MKTPILLAMAGPNGSGKSTVISEFPPIGEYVNADEIQRILNCNSLEAAQIAERTRETLLAQNKSFTFETVLSTERNIFLMERAKENGYTVICVYVLTCDPKININRVESRVKNGGHSVPPEKIESRYHRAMKLFPRLFTMCDEIYVYDNSLDRNDGEPRLILHYDYGQLRAYPNEIWTKEMLESLCNGSYSVE
ncbi:MAG: zeta toxin family protein [Eubacterium sp.]|nr:zeta toxin family protein [Eubacterium sp.]